MWIEFCDTFIYMWYISILEITICLKGFIPTLDKEAECGNCWVPSSSPPSQISARARRWDESVITLQSLDELDLFA